MKKIVFVSVTAAVAMFVAAGVAYAGDDDDQGNGGHSHHSRGDHDVSHQGPGSTNCTSDDNVHQSNRGQQAVGGNLGAQDVAGNVLGAQSTRPAGICPSIGNNNDL
jgi:hypothetical protein